jgi:Uma2 family endonuclease
MSEPARQLVSEEMFLSLPATTQKTELLDGEVVVSPSADFWHQEILLRILVEMRLWARRNPPHTVVAAPSDVRFAPGRILQPDAYVLDSKPSLRHQGPIDRIPILCVEVVSDRVYDRVTKRMIYAQAGVPEYWLVEQAGLVERRSGPGLDTVEEIRDTLTTPLLSGLRIDVRALFAD